MLPEATLSELTSIVAPVAVEAQVEGADTKSNTNRKVYLTGRADLTIATVFKGDFVVKDPNIMEALVDIGLIS